MDSADNVNVNEPSSDDHSEQVLPISNASRPLVGRCPAVEVEMGGVWVKCLLDTGSMVNTITESFFKQVFQPWGVTKFRSCGWLVLRAANGLDIPYVGYLELDLQVLGKKVPGHWVLVVKDTPCASQSRTVPGLLGINVIIECYRELFAQQGEALFASLAATQTGACWEPVFRHCHKLEAFPLVPDGRVRVLEKTGEFIPAGSVKFVKVTCPRVPYAPPATMLLDPGGSDLAPGLLLSPSLVTVDNGVAHVPVVNVGKQWVKELLQRYNHVFAKHEGELGCTEEIVHEIPLLDETPIRQRYRRIPFKQWQALKDHIKQLLESRVIR